MLSKDVSTQINNTPTLWKSFHKVYLSILYRLNQIRLQEKHKVSGKTVPPSFCNYNMARVSADGPRKQRITGNSNSNILEKWYVPIEIVSTSMVRSLALSTSCSATLGLFGNFQLVDQLSVYWAILSCCVSLVTVMLLLQVKQLKSSEYKNTACVENIFVESFRFTKHMLL